MSSLRTPCPAARIRTTARAVAVLGALALASAPVLRADWAFEGAAAEGAEAVRAFRSLSAAEQMRLIRNLGEALRSMPDWIEALTSQGPQLLCYGERHTEVQRRFGADEFFARLPAHTLYLEASPDELEGILRRVDRGDAEVPLRLAGLDIDIARTIRAARSANGGVRILGADVKDGEYRRDESMARRIRESFVPSGLHIALLGALHCSDRRAWLYGKLSEAPGSIDPRRMLNVDVLDLHEESDVGVVGSFDYFRKALGLGSGTTVLTSRKLDPWFLEWFPDLRREAAVYAVMILLSEGEASRSR